MRFDPLHRLTRPIPGEHVGEFLSAPGSGMEQKWERDRPLDRPSPVPARDAATGREARVKMITRTAEVRPNAPLLIRLVRHPYALSTGRGKRVAYREAAAAPNEARVDWHAEIRASIADRQRPDGPVVEPRPLPFTVRPSSWQLLPDPQRGRAE